MHIQLYFRINPIPRLEIDKAMTNGSAVYILLGEMLCPPRPPSHFSAPLHEPLTPLPLCILPSRP